MVLPIYAYGNKILSEPADDVEPEDEGLSELIEQMWETMYASSGVGLAAPQVGRSLRLFVMDAGQLDENYHGLKRVIINPEILEPSAEKVNYEEGCLSIPHIREEIKRPETVTIGYEDEEFNYYEETFSDIPARIIQHEMDHLEGILFVDRVSSLRKRLLKKRLENIARGNVKVDYPMEFPIGKKKAAKR